MLDLADGAASLKAKYGSRARACQTFHEKNMRQAVEKGNRGTFRYLTQSFYLLAALSDSLDLKWQTVD